MIPQYDVFLSYSRKDTDTMQRIYQTLQEEGLRIWIDANLMDVDPSKPEWKDAIEKGIEASRSVVVILSPDAKQSDWVKRELDYAYAQHKPIFPVLVRGTQQDAVPFLLVSHQRAENNNGETKMMVDLLTLVCNGLDIAPTPLIRQYQERQKQLEAEHTAQRKARDAQEIENLVQKEVAERLRNIEQDEARQATFQALSKFFGFSKRAAEFNASNGVALTQLAFVYETFRWIARLSIFLFGLSALFFKIAYDNPLGFGYLQTPAIFLFGLAIGCLLWLRFGHFPVAITHYVGKVRFSIYEKQVTLKIPGSDKKEAQLCKKTQRRIREIHGMQSKYPFDINATYRLYVARRPDGKEFLLSVEPLPPDSVSVRDSQRYVLTKQGG